MLVGRVAGADRRMAAGVADRDAVQHHARTARSTTGRRAAWRGSSAARHALAATAPEHDRRDGRARGQRAPNRSGRCGERRAEPAQQRGAPLKPNERIVGVDLKMPRQRWRLRCPRSASRRSATARSGSDENAPAPNIARLAIASPSERAKREPARRVAIAPRRRRRRHRAARSRSRDRSAVRARSSGSARQVALPSSCQRSTPPDDEVPPAAVIGNAQIRIGLARHLARRQSATASRRLVLDGEVRRAARRHPVMHHAAALAHRVRAAQRQRSPPALRSDGVRAGRLPAVAVAIIRRAPARPCRRNRRAACRRRNSRPRSWPRSRRGHPSGSARRGATHARRW